MGTDRSSTTQAGGATNPLTELTALAAAMVRPGQQETRPPCCAGCLSGTDIRAWISTVAQRRTLGLSEREAYARAWSLVAAVNPFPSTLGRICPHPCELNCSRRNKDGAVAVNALERFLGDWALEQRLPLPRLAEAASRPESIGVIGAGPAGLSFAYQMARRGYRVTVYEKQEKPGGMLYYGIPQYRLPEDVLDSEVRRILELGVELRTSTAIGRDLPVPVVRDRHDVLFLGIGAGRGLRLGIPGEEGTGVWTGTEYLARLNRGDTVKLGARVVVIGGGNTAIDAARAARRSGARVTVLYRRTRTEMPAIEAEIDDALAEGVDLRFLVAPVEITRDDGRVCSVVVRRMELGEPDGSGRRRSLALMGTEHDVPADSVIAAVSQQPNWEGLGELNPGSAWVEAGGSGEVADGLWTGGDTRGLGVAAMAIGQGRQAAEAVHSRLSGLPSPVPSQRPVVSAGAVKPDYYAECDRVASVRRPLEEWLTQPDAEIRGTISEEEFLREVSRCFSCGLCFGCERCFMFCNAGGFTRLEQVKPGAYFALSLDHCEACGKCIDLCPCGFLERC